MFVKLNKCSDRSMGREKYDRPTDLQTNQPTNRQTDMRDHWEVENPEPHGFKQNFELLTFVLKTLLERLG